MHLDQLQSFLQAIEPAAQLVESRVLRRVIRLDRRLQAFRLTIPHERSYTIDRDRLLAFVDLSELAVPASSDLPRRVVLLVQPDDDELADEVDWQALRDRYQRLLFHACIHLELETHLTQGPFVNAWAKARREQIGEVEFAEIREVLFKEDLLFQTPTDAEAYIEFAAVALELQWGAPEDLPYFFPAVRDWQQVQQIFEQDLNLERLFLRFGRRLEKRPGELPGVPLPDVPRREIAPGAGDASHVAPTVRKPPAGTAISRGLGGALHAALSWVRSRRDAAPQSEAEAEAAAEAELTRLSERLQEVLGLPADEREQWRTALLPLLGPAREGFWSNEARLLYDLQKVCSEQERDVYRLDPMGWIRTLGRRPLRRPLPLMRDVLTLRHLRTVRRRMAVARVSAAQRARLTALVDGVLPRIEARSRDQLRRIINGVFDRVDFVPGNVLETVARRKLVEELVDRIIERSYVTMADLRDAISKNDLKLADVTTVSELVFGTCLLRADRKFDTALDGVYRRGAVYLRWPQTLSSVVFGSNIGRFLTQHLIVPFGGAYLLLEFLRHTTAMVSGQGAGPVPPPAAGAPAAGALVEAAPVVHSAHSAPSAAFYVGVLLLGAWLSMLIHRPEFRAWNLSVLSRTWAIARRLTVELPSQLLNSPWVRQVLASRSFAVLRSYLLEPGLLAGLLYLVPLLKGVPWSGRTFLELLLGSALFLNSAIGRSISERTIDYLVRAWQDLKMHFFAALVRGIMDLFDRIFTLLERTVYTVDEWLRFRTGDNKITQAVKLAGSMLWFLVSYVVVFVFTLLVEPQINPIKHFPVVTVAHKVILPTGPMFVSSLTPYLGVAWAQTLVWTTIWLVPGMFGFLVWELRENWRLYAANRSERLGPESIGEHGETMLRLLRPGFHSGTLPRAYAAVRRAAEKAGPRETSRIQRRRSAIEHVEEAVRHFVERELIVLLETADVLDECELRVGTVHAATNRIDVDVLCDDLSTSPLRLSWKWLGGELVGVVDPPGWADELTAEQRHSLSVALAELFQRAGVDRVEGSLPRATTLPITRQESIAFWSRRDVAVELAPSLGAS